MIVPFALPAGEPTQLPADREVKVVWAVTGEGDFAVKMNHPNGTVVEPDWGPDPHGSSNWDAPGDEWEAAWTLPSVGCWTFTVTRGSDIGDSTHRLVTRPEAAHITPRREPL